MSLTPGKIVCITGASRGIGRACAVQFAQHGAAGLILHYLGDEETEKEVEALKAEIQGIGARVVTIPGDIGNVETTNKIVSAGVAAFGRIDVLVSNVGICPFSEFLTMPLETWERTRQVNLDGTFYIVQGKSPQFIKRFRVALVFDKVFLLFALAVALQMSKQTPQGGSLIAISSISGLLGGAQQCHYGPTKAAITNLMQNCAVALGKYGIRANAVLPGTIATDINKEDLKNEAKREYMVNRTLLGRLGNPDDVAGPVIFLASDLARYMTGSSLIVDGGLFVNFQ